MFCGLDKVFSNNLKDLSCILFWQALLAELIGTGLLVALGCGSCLSANWKDDTSLVVQIAFTFGLSVASIVRAIGHISGGHINPAVSIAMFITRRITLVRLLMYVAVQLSGAIFGALILKAVTPMVHEGDICSTTLNLNMRPIDGLVVEALITFVLVFTIFACIDPHRANPGGSTPLAIGLVVVLNHLFAIRYTGSSINPARSFGSAVVGGTWKLHYVYWVGPIVGAIVAAIIYDFFLSTNANLAKFKNYLIDSEYNPEGLYGDKKMQKENQVGIENTNV